MAPRTRLQRQPSRRVQYVAGSRANPIEIEDTPEPAAPISTRTRRGAGQKSGYSGVKKGKAVPKKTLKKAVLVKKSKPKRECIICINTKVISPSFKLDGDEDACEHFYNICNGCIESTVNGKTETRQFPEAGLACFYPGCDHVLDMSTLKKALTKTAFKKYDAALTKHFLSASPNFIACLNPECGEYFSIEDCSNGTNDTATPNKTTKGKGKAKAEAKHAPKKLITCPYCGDGLCITCKRPWHAKTDCSKVKEAEDAASLAQIQALGAKQCPQCGINIEKRGGCDHMTCDRCHHNFCWVCLVTYDGREHAEGCIHGRRNVAAEMGNWIAENATLEQINAAIEHARRRLDDPNVERQQREQDVVVGNWPGVEFFAPQGAAGQQVAQNFLQQLQGMVAGMPNFFGGGGGGAPAAANGAANGAGNGA